MTLRWLGWQVFCAIFPGGVVGVRHLAQRPPALKTDFYAVLALFSEFSLLVAIGVLCLLVHQWWMAPIIAGIWGLSFLLAVLIISEHDKAKKNAKSQRPAKDRT